VKLLSGTITLQLISDMIKRLVALILFFHSALFINAQEKPLYQSPAFSIYPSKVAQGDFQATARSATELVSNYESAANNFLSPVIDFKFSINGKDNEMPSGIDHHFTCPDTGGDCITPLIRFGSQVNVSEKTPGKYLQLATKMKIRLDMRHVFREFDSVGYYTAFNGSKIYRADFKGVYVAGGTPPLSWDFDNLQNFVHLKMSDPDGDHIYEVTLMLNDPASKRGQRHAWKKERPTGAYPQLKSPFPIVDALYNLSLEEMLNAVEPDSTLRTGKEWAGVWTRDVSYSIILSMAVLQPKAAQYSLMRKVKDGVIVQDTGTGGAYPVSTDRIVWALAAWEIFKVTGDSSWLKTVYPIIKKSIEADLVNAFDESTGLMRGESSFLDWREQTYPEWMEPADIYKSICLGTNAVHYQANVIAAAMATILNDDDAREKHELIAKRIREGMNQHLWMADRGYYGQYLYGRTSRLLSPKSEALGEALAILFGIPDEKDVVRIVNSTPVGAYGIPCIFPQIANIPPYHNDAVWPFVQSYWALAAAKGGNDEALMHSFASIWRPAALFLTNKENYVASTGDYASTQINSDNMLWSLSGNIALIYKVIFGIDYDQDLLTFKPFIPEALKGNYTLRNFRYRNATLDIAVSGYGNKIASIRLDGKSLKNAQIPSTLSGKHRLEIKLANNRTGGTLNMQEHRVSPPTPVISYNGKSIQWAPVPGAVKYLVYVSGEHHFTITDTSLNSNLPQGMIQVVAVDAAGLESFASEPLLLCRPEDTIVVEAEALSEDYAKAYAGFSGSGYVHTAASEQPLRFEIKIPVDGVYALDFRYANGHGPVNTDNKCAIRRVAVDGKVVGTIVLPQRGKGEWSDWGYTNRVMVTLKKGKIHLEMIYDPANRNMNGETNEAVVDHVRLVKIQ